MASAMNVFSQQTLLFVDSVTDSANSGQVLNDKLKDSLFREKKPGEYGYISGAREAIPTEGEAINTGVNVILVAQGGIGIARAAPSLWARVMTFFGKEAASSGAESAFAGANLSKHLGYLERYGQAGFKELESGRIRYYGTMTAARTEGEMAGARLVREWSPASGATRTWYETLDHAGRVRSVAPKPVTEELNHRIFDTDGNYTGRR